VTFQFAYSIIRKPWSIIAHNSKELSVSVPLQLFKVLLPLPLKGGANHVKSFFTSSALIICDMLKKLDSAAKV